MSDSMLGNGGARNAARAIRKRKQAINAVGEDAAPSAKASTLAAPKRDVIKGSYKERQMQDAIKMMKKTKTANRNDYETYTF